MTARAIWALIAMIGCGTWAAYVRAMQVFPDRYPPDGTVDLMLMGGLAALAMAVKQ